MELINKVAFLSIKVGVLLYTNQLRKAWLQAGSYKPQPGIKDVILKYALH